MKLRELYPSFSRIWKLKRLSVAPLQDFRSTDLPVTVSMTAIPSRLKAVALTVRSIFAQRCMPKQIELWLHHSVRSMVPESLSQLVGDRFAIQYTELDSPHCKLVPALLNNPNRLIVTCDDDLIYPVDWLETLYSEHLLFPDHIVCTTARFMRVDAAGELLPYREWPHQFCRGGASANLLPLGSGGVLYPQGCLHPDVVDVDTYLQWCPKADDLWFKVMAVRANRQTRLVCKPLNPPLPIPFTQKISLKKTNIGQDLNREQMRALIHHFGITAKQLGI